MSASPISNASGPQLQRLLAADGDQPAQPTERTRAVVTDQTKSSSGPRLSDDLIAQQFGLERGRSPAGGDDGGFFDAIEEAVRKAVEAVQEVAEATQPLGPFESADEAAVAALDRANPVSIDENIEYGGLIYKDENGQYWATAPTHGTGTSFDPYAVDIPDDTTLVGDYHTHANYSETGPDGNPVATGDPNRDDYNSDNFSETDLRGIAADAEGKEEYTGYLGTPGGEYKKFDPATGRVTPLE